MALTVSAKSGTKSTPAPAGTHIARCCKVIDLGTQKSDGQYGVKIQEKILIMWELPTELRVFKEENGPEPFVVSKEYTAGLSEKSNLRADLQSWRGRPFTTEELEGFSVAKLVGAACTLGIVHKPGKKDPSQVYANISSLSPVMKGMNCPQAIIPPVLYEIEMGKNEVFQSLPEWIQNKIATCENWKHGYSGATSEEEAQAAGADEEASTRREILPF